VGGTTLIFISGIHGVGKSFFTEKVKERCEIATYTASTLIAEFKKCVFDSNKKVDNIFDNQQILLEALKEKSTTDKEFLLDGHFCLLDKSDKISRIEFNTYVDLEPKAIVLLTEHAEIIAERRKVRDGIIMDIEATAMFQKEEELYAIEVAKELKIPIYISTGSADIDKAIDFIMQNI
jgi:adenylate kinase